MNKKYNMSEKFFIFLKKEAKEGLFVDVIRKFEDYDYEVTFVDMEENEDKCREWIESKGEEMPFAIYDGFLFEGKDCVLVCDDGDHIYVVLHSLVNVVNGLRLAVDSIKDLQSRTIVGEAFDNGDI